MFSAQNFQTQCAYTCFEFSTSQCLLLLSPFEYRVTKISEFDAIYLTRSKIIDKPNILLEITIWKKIQDYYEHLSVPDNSGRMRLLSALLIGSLFDKECKRWPVRRRVRMNNKTTLRKIWSILYENKCKHQIRWRLK